jgi:hypothetical protein
MPFDAKKFMAAQFEPRMSEISVPGLVDFFGPDEQPVWKVRGQTADEVARTIEAGDKHRNIDAVIAAIGENSDKIQELRDVIGISKERHTDIIKRLEQLTMCSVEPAITLDIAVKLAETRPIELYILTNEILRLTGLGQDLKKSPTSGKIKKSEA